jgi:hypothetical protein
MIVFVDFQNHAWVLRVRELVGNFQMALSPPDAASMMLHVVVQPSSLVVAVVVVVVVNYQDFLSIVAWMLRVVVEPSSLLVAYLQYQLDGPMTELVAVDHVVVVDPSRRTMMVL